MSRPGISVPIRGFLHLSFRNLFLVLIPLVLQISCSYAQVLKVPLDEAAEQLRSGNTEFIQNAELQESFAQAESSVAKLLAIHSGAPFYAMLLIGDNAPGKLETLLCCAALESPSPAVRNEAALKLIPLILDFENSKDIEEVLGFLDSPRLMGKRETVPALKAACFFKLGRFAECVRQGAPGKEETKSASIEKLEKWRRAISLFAEWNLFPGNNKQETAAFLFSPLPPEILAWACREAFAAQGLLLPEEEYVLNAKLSAAAPSQVNYMISLGHFRKALDEGGEVFFRYPELISDLGRAYQYVPAFRDEGYELFKGWAELRLTEDSSGSQDEVALNKREFLILFWAGRIQRARANYNESSEYFSRALTVAPDALQGDACIWYMLMNAFAKDPSAAVQLTLATMPRWNDVSYFSDILDLLSGFLSSGRQWDTMMEILSSLELKEGSASLAQYAYIMGRAVEEGFINTADRSAENFFTAAFKAGKASYYYRAMAANRMGTPFVLEARLPGSPGNAEVRTRITNNQAELEFLLGFFEYGAASFALPYIREREAELSFSDLKKIAGALGTGGFWKDSLDLVSRYSSRKDYDNDYEDFFLFYPRPFIDLVEKHANETGLEAETLYALIRTESYFKSDIVSRSGAAGLTQLMQPTALEMAGRIARQGGPDYREGGLDLINPEVNIHIGAYYLRYLNEQLGNPILAILAYNGGIGSVRRWLAADRRKGALPFDLFLETVEYAETREYGRRVLGAAAVYSALYY